MIVLKKYNAKKIYFIYSGASAFFFTLVFTISSIYFIQQVKLNPLQLVLVGTFLEAAVFIFEIPTGIVADLHSRKLSILIGLVLISSGFLLQGIVPLFTTILTAQILWGIGYTFLSGADTAWIADESGAKDLTPIFFKATQIRQLLTFFATFISIGLGTIALNLPILLAGILFIALAIFLLVFMPEENFTKTPSEERENWHDMLETLKEGLSLIKKKKLFTIILLVAVFTGLYSEGFDRLWHLHFIKDINLPPMGQMKPFVWFSIINSVAMLLSIGTVEVIKRRVEARGEITMIWALFLINLGLMFSIFFFAMSGQFVLGLITYWSAYILRSNNYPIYSAWINQHIDKSHIRPTIISMTAQLDAFGEIIGGPIIGFIATRYSAPVGIGLAAALVLPVPLLYLYTFIKFKSNQTKRIDSGY